jgi:Pentapeptide repeats (8 copies)
MITHRMARRPEPWAVLRRELKHGWVVPFRAFEWLWEWIAFGLSRWSFLEVLEYLGGFSVLVGVIFYFSESGDRVKQRHYQAWQVINTAQGKGGSGGRIEALQELNEDKIPLVGVDVSSAFLQGVHLEHANLLRADMNAADLRGSDFSSANMTFANLNDANLRGARLENVSLSNASLKDSDLVGTDLSGSDLSQTDLSGADLRSANLSAVKWKEIRSIKSANIAGLKGAPEGFIQWALANGAVQNVRTED